jgi:two-component system, cell cycle response regulator DivK
MATILLIEDNEMNRDMLSRRLVRKSYEMLLAADGEEGIVVAQTQMPDLILMDITLPGISGLDATRILKEQQSTRDIPIIALTALAMVGDCEQALQAGCDDYDTKPVELARLLGKMESLLKAKRARSE